jgi:Protein of unknown function (DUF559)
VSEFCRSAISRAHICVVHDLDRLFAVLAAHQEGVASLRQAHLLGFSRSAIDHRRRSGRWQLALPSVVHMNGAPDTWESRLMAGVLRLGERAVVSHHAAAVLHGLDGARRSTVEFTVPRGEDHVGGGLLVHSTRRLAPVDLTVVRRSVPKLPRRDRAPLASAGLVRAYRVTTASRTILDLAPHVDAETLGSLIDSAARTGLSSPSFLSKRLADLRGPGVGGVRLLDEVMLDSGGHSWLERRFLRLLREAGLPRPRPQVVKTRNGRFVARVDFDFAPALLVVEVSGRRGHTSDADRRRDARRRNELQSLGIVVLEFTTTDVISAPELVVDELVRHLRRSSPQ